MKILKYKADHPDYSLYFLKDGEELITVTRTFNKMTKKKLIEFTEKHYKEKFDKIRFNIPRIFKFVDKKWNEKKQRWVSTYKVGIFKFYKYTIFKDGKQLVSYGL